MKRWTAVKRWTVLLILLPLALLVPALLAQDAAREGEPREGALRIAQLLPGTEGLEVTVAPLGEGPGEGVTFSPLSFRDVSDYRTLASGTYTVTVRRGGETVIETAYGIGHRHYTLMLYGLLAGEAPQPRNLWTRLTSWLAGLEASSANGWVAQHRMLLDRPGRLRGQAGVRVIHGTPGLAPVALELRPGRGAAGDGAEPIAYGTLAYPDVGGQQEIRPGEWTVVARPPASPLTLLEHVFTARPDRLTTIFLVGSVEPASPPRLVVALSP